LLRNDIELQFLLMSIPRPNSRALVREWLNRRNTDPEAVFFVIAQCSNDQPVGFLQIVNLDRIHRRGELGICISSMHQGKGFAREAMTLIESYLLTVFCLRKLTLEVLSRNKRALEFYRKIGYLEVGIRLKHFYGGGMFHDVCVMEKFLDAERENP
jgi:RimJ/RimL family protein N-acetyltransferase